MTDIARLRRDHTDLANLSGRLRSAIDARPLDTLSIARHRDAIGAALSEHLRIEDDDLYPALATHPDPEVAAMARRFSDDMGTLGAWWGAYAAKWTAAAIAAAPDAFRAETEHVLAALEARIVLEDRELFPRVEVLDEEFRRRAVGRSHEGNG